uniref:Nucleoside diphosphate kinase-like domain-containing protein n=1 Tax=Pelusios castaneus TaxID=367368 RepID=A0A8C8SXB1_9SAUR
MTCCRFLRNLDLLKISLLIVTKAGFIVSQMKETNFTHEMAAQFYKAHEGKPFFDQLVNYMSEGPSMIMILTKENAVEEWRQLMGPTDPDIAKDSSPDSLRAQFAQDILRNAVHGSSNKEHALNSIEYLKCGSLHIPLPVHLCLMLCKKVVIK